MPGQGWWTSAINLADLDGERYPGLSYLVSPVLPVGGLVQLAGPPKSGKSLLALGAALAVGSGGVAFGRLKVTEPGDVLYVSLDDTSRARAQRRARDLMCGEPLPAAVTLATEPIGRGVVARDALHGYLSQHPRCRLVVLDTVEHLRADRRGLQSVYGADVEFLALLRSVCAAHPLVTLLALMHTRKGEDEDPVEAVAGTHGVTGGADVVLRLTGRRGTPRRIMDVVSRDDEDRRYVLSLTRAGMALTDEDPDDPSVQLTRDDAALYRAVQGFPDGVSARDLADALPDVTGIGDRLSRLAKGGYLTRTGRGVYRT